MPAGVSWSRYLTFFAASLASGLAGSQAVHLYYKPSLVRMIYVVFFSSFMLLLGSCEINPEIKSGLRWLHRIIIYGAACASAVPRLYSFLMLKYEISIPLGCERYRFEITCSPLSIE